MERCGTHHTNGPLFDCIYPEIIDSMNSTTEGRATADQVMVDGFGTHAYRLFDQRPKLQLVTTAPSTTTGDRT